MRLLITFTTYITITGAISDSQRLEVKEGENVPLVTKTPEMAIVNRVDLLKYYENGTMRLMYRYCSPKEEKTGCVAVQPERISPQPGNITVTLPNVCATDARQYVVQVIGNNFTNKTSFTLVFPDSSGGQFMTTISPDGVVVIPVVIPVVIGVLITAVLIAVFIICVYKKKNQKKPKDQQDSTADSSSETSLIEMQEKMPRHLDCIHLSIHSSNHSSLKGRRDAGSPPGVLGQKRVEPWTDDQSDGIHSDATNLFIIVNMDHTDCNYDTYNNNNNNNNNSGAIDI